ncbi:MULTISPECIES: hypothetical protein [unclassified Methylophilus]|uniref:hypothetical protein n=1 Tax=unclassified Methylophilus TaxID=2630143 RepID=UPI0023B267E0|nr:MULTISPECIES: hypothetical protein [unclassified Methylophilus]MDT7848057.1 hypothetical protein [Methylophilus sp. VKM B-3414]BEV07469.1 hypothetical protein MTDW_07690 [Methylophilus sp. DW102]
MSLETWELLSYVVTVVGLPLAIVTFVLEQRKERENEDEEVYQLLADNYTDFLKLVMAHPDLQLRSNRESLALSAEQEERKLVLFEILISLFERAYLLAYDPDMRGKRLRRWMSWEDYMREWCQREDFRQHLPRLLVGEDADFVAHISQIAHEVASAQTR